MTDTPKIELSAGSLAFAEEMLAEFVRDPGSVSPDWRTYFESLDGGANETLAKSVAGPTFRPPTLFDPSRSAAAPPNGETPRKDARSPSRRAP